MKKCTLLLIVLSLFFLAQSQRESPWLTSGNSGTNPALHFLGTTDNHPLRFRINNVYAGEIDSVGSKTFFGFGAGKAVTTGYENTAIGFKSFYSNTTGVKNTACGAFTLYSNTYGSQNVAIGDMALYSNTIGYYNSANGYSALRYNTSGNYNTADGWEALIRNTTGSANIANGFNTLYANTTGSYNTANGSVALTENTSGSYNTANGVSALGYNSTASYNTAEGSYSLYNNTTGFYNTASGAYTLYNTYTSQYNTAMGYGAATNYNMGWNNTFIGAYSDVNGTGYYNCVAVGEAVTCTAPSQARIGNSSTVSIGGYVGWSNISDGRFKKDIKEEVKGLEFISKLRPVTYHLDITGLNKKLNESRDKEMNASSKLAIAEKEKILYSGFVAQEVEQAAKETGYDFSGVDKPKNENDLYGLRYGEFVVPLVKAVQELSAQNTELKKQVDDLQKRMERLESSFITKK